MLATLCFNRGVILKLKPRSRSFFYDVKIVDYLPMNSTISNLVYAEIVKFIGRQSTNFTLLKNPGKRVFTV